MASTSAATMSAQEEMADYEDMPAPVVVERKAIVLPWMILQCILMYLGPRCVLCDELPRWLHAFYCPRCNAVLARGDDGEGVPRTRVRGEYARADHDGLDFTTCAEPDQSVYQLSQKENGKADEED